MKNRRNRASPEALAHMIGFPVFLLTADVHGKKTGGMKPYQGDPNDWIAKNACSRHDDSFNGLVLGFSSGMGRQ
jgi:hypothetical protein